MRVLRVLSADRSLGVFESFTPEWAKSTEPVKVQVRCNRFGAMNYSTVPRDKRICQLALNGMNVCALHAESELYEDAGWVTVAEYSRWGLLAMNETSSASRTFMEATVTGDLMKIQRVYKFDQKLGSVSQLTTGLFAAGETFKWNDTENCINFSCCTFRGAHLGGEAHNVVSYTNCNLEYSSFKDAVFRANGQATQFNSCHIMGVKYFISLNQSPNNFSHKQIYRDMTYDALSLDPYRCEGVVRATDILFIKKGKQSLLEKKPLDVETLLKKPDYLATPTYEPKKGEGLLNYERELVSQRSTKVSFNRELYNEGDIKTCDITGFVGKREQMHNAYVERSVLMHYGVPELAIPITDAPHNSRVRGAARVFATNKKLNVINLVMNRCFLCHVSGLICDQHQQAVSEEGHYVLSYLNNASLVQEYNFRPEPEFQLGKGETNRDDLLKFGFELEVEFNPEGAVAKKLSAVDREMVRQNKRGFHDRMVEKVCDGMPVYCKHDGSLHFGFEIVTHPFSWNWWQQNRDTKVKSMLETLSSGGYISHDSGRCGLHVHMSKAAFAKGKLYGPDGKVKFEGNTHLMRFCAMVYRNPKFMVWLSRRDQADPRFAKISTWSGGRGGNEAMKNIAQMGRGPGHGNRYEAVNTMPEYTNELRIFRGTLNFKSFCSSIELCHALWAYTAVPTNCVSDGAEGAAVLEFVDWVHKTLYYDAQGKRQRVYPHLDELLIAKRDQLDTILKQKVNVFAEETWELPVKHKAKGAV